MRVLIALGFLLILTGIIIFLFYVPSLRISRVQITGLSIADEKELRTEILTALSSRRYLIIPKDHLVLFQRKEIETLLSNKFRVKQFDLKKDFPSGLKIVLSERETWAVWCRASNLENCFLIDQGGVVFEKAAGFAGSAVLKIIDARDEDFLGKNVLPNQSFEKISLFREWIKDQVGEEIRKVNIKSSGKTFLLYTRAGWYVLIDDETDITKAIENLVLGLSEIKEGRSKLEYIDLRFPDKIFYKFK